MNKIFRKRYGKDAVEEKNFVFSGIEEYEPLLLGLPGEILFGYLSYDNPIFGISSSALRIRASIKNYNIYRKLSSYLEEDHDSIEELELS